MQDNGYNDRTMNAGKAGTDAGATFRNAMEYSIPTMPKTPHGPSQAVALFMNRYRVIKELGRGGMGMVYHCFDEVGKIEVALKTLPPELSHNQAEMEDIRDNFQIVHKLSHSNIAAVHQIEKDPATGDCYIIMEYVNGMELRSWMRERRKESETISLAETLPVLRQIAAAMDYAHAKNVIHRDIKPANIMLTQDGEVKLLDFGLAAQLHSSMSNVSMAVTGRAGTAAYMSPEQMNGSRQKAAADQYALAVVAYEMLAGHRPFDCPDFEMLKSAVMTNDPEPVEGIPGYAWKALKKALAKKPEDRFASCADFVDALEGKKPVSGGKAKKNGRAAFIGGAVLVVLLVLWGASALLKPETSAAPSPAPPETQSSQPEPAVSQPDVSPVQVEPIASQSMAQLEQETYALQARLQALKPQIDKAAYARGQTFGEHLDAFERNFASAEGVMKDTGNPNRFARAHEWYEAANEECRWLRANAPLRQNASAVLSNAEDSREKARAEGAETLGRIDFVKADEALAAARADYESGAFEAVHENARIATDAFRKAFSVALSANVQNLVEAGKIAFQAKNWTEAADAAAKALAKDSTNAEAKKLKSDAETQLKPWLKVIATVDGNPVAATVNYQPEIVSRDESGIVELKKGKSYSLSVNCEKNGVAWTGTRQISVDWGGIHEETIALKKMEFTGTVSLPGNVTLEMVKIQAGRFQMGSPASEEGREGDESRHRVTLTKDYWLGKYEVTQEQYEAVMGTNPSNFKNGGNYPVECVSWDDAMDFCRKLNERMKGKLPSGYEFSLPTEAQWEYACRAGTDTSLNSGRNMKIIGLNNSADLDQVGWYGGNCGRDYTGAVSYDISGWKEKQYGDTIGGSHPVGQKKANAWGLYDMHGNVWEWCSDWYGNYPSGNQTDPVGSTTGSDRVNRGGSWGDYARFCRSADRFGSVPGYRNRNLGFRLALVPVQ